MSELQYKVIKAKKQYYEYCRRVEELAFAKVQNKATDDEIELLTLLIEKWDKDHDTLGDADPVEVLKSLMESNGMKAVELAKLLNVTKGLVSEILSYKKGMSKDIIRKLSTRFKLSQEAFNKPYKLIGDTKSRTAIKRRKRQTA